MHIYLDPAAEIFISRLIAIQESSYFDKNTLTLDWVKCTWLKKYIFVQIDNKLEDARFVIVVVYT